MSFIQNGGSYTWNITNNGITYGPSNIVGGSLTDALYSGISIGNTISRQLDLELQDYTLSPQVLVNLDTTKPVVLSLIATNAQGATTTYQKGTYFIDTIDESPYSEVTKLTAYDAMLKAEVPYMKTGEWTATTDAAILTEIATNVLGVTIETNTAALFQNPKAITEMPSIGDNGTTCREMLSVIGIMRGGNWIINDQNELELVPLTGRLSSPANITIGDEVMSFDVSPTETVTRVEIWASNSVSYRAPFGLTEAQWEARGGIILSANMTMMASQELADSLYAIYNGFVYIPYTANGAYLGPEALLGAGLIIKNDTVVLANRTLSLDILAASDLSADATQAQKSSYPVLSSSERSLQRQINQTQASVSVLDSSIVSVVYSVDEVEDAVNTMQGTVNGLSNTLSQTSGAVSSLSTTVEQLSSGITTTITNQINSTVPGMVADGVEDLARDISVYMRYYLVGGKGVLELGDANNEFIAQLDNTQLAFLQGGQAVAYLSNNKLYITEAEVLTNLQIGNYQWATDETGRMSLKWVE